MEQEYPTIDNARHVVTQAIKRTITEKTFVTDEWGQLGHKVLVGGIDEAADEIYKYIAGIRTDLATANADYAAALYTLGDLSRQLQERTEALEPANQYTPWVELGLTETQYYKRRYLEMSRENARLTAECEAAENLIHYCDIPDWALPELATYQQARAARVQAAAPGTGEEGARL